MSYEVDPFDELVQRERDTFQRAQEAAKLIAAWPGHAAVPVSPQLERPPLSRPMELAEAVKVDGLRVARAASGHVPTDVPSPNYLFWRRAWALEPDVSYRDIPTSTGTDSSPWGQVHVPGSRQAITSQLVLEKSGYVTKVPTYIGTPGTHARVREIGWMLSLDSARRARIKLARFVAIHALDI